MPDLFEVIPEPARVDLQTTTVTEVLAGTPAQYRLRNGWLAVAGEVLVAGDTVVAQRVGQDAVVLFQPV